MQFPRPFHCTSVTLKTILKCTVGKVFHVQLSGEGATPRVWLKEPRGGHRTQTTCATLVPASQAVLLLIPLILQGD